MSQNWNKPRTAGRMVEGRKAWANLPWFDAILFVGAGAESKREYAPDCPPVRIELRRQGYRRNPTVISLTHMTIAELDVFQEFMNHAIARARPICETLDKRAREAFENGDDSFERLYRQVPVFVDRERGITEHGEGVPSGLEGAGELNVSGDHPEQDDDGDSGGDTSDDPSSGDVPEHDQ